MNRFRYSFDKDLYYSGLVYPISELNGHPIYPENSTEYEPFWKDGFIPRFNLTLNNWTMEPRDHREKVLDVEIEVSRKLEKTISNMLAQHREMIFKDISKIIIHMENRYLSNMSGNQREVAECFEEVKHEITDAMLDVQKEIIDAKKYLSPIRTLIRKLLVKLGMKRD